MAQLDQAHTRLTQALKNTWQSIVQTVGASGSSCQKASVTRHAAIAAVAKALYSIPHPYVGQWITAWADTVQSENSAEPLGGAIVVAKEPTKPLAAADEAPRRPGWIRRDQPVLQTLVIPFPVIVLSEGDERATEMRLAQDLSLPRTPSGRPN